MSKVYVLSDLHLGHHNICNFRTQFSDREEHDNFILDNYKSIVTKRDTVIFLGDVAFDFEALEKVKELEGNKILVCGNHDIERGISMKHLVGTYGKVYALHKKKGCWLSHAPIHPEELRGKFNVHGHVHSATLQKGWIWKKPHPSYFNASMENIDYRPKDFQEILAELRERNKNALDN